MDGRCPRHEKENFRKRAPSKPRRLTSPAAFVKTPCGAGRSPEPSSRPGLYTLSPERLEKLLTEASRTVARLPRQPFENSWAYLHAMLRLLRAFQLGEYRAVPSNALLSIVAAVAYLIDPNDFIPDEIPFLGFLDDATIIEFAAQKTRSTLDQFMAWELRRLLKK